MLWMIDNGPWVALASGMTLGVIVGLVNGFAPEIAEWIGKHARGLF